MHAKLDKHFKMLMDSLDERQYPVLTEMDDPP